jgi:hypothetical protein
VTVLIANNASSFLPSQVNNSQTGIVLTPGDGAKFPDPQAGEWFPVTLFRSNGSALEICRCTGRSGDTLTVVRGQEGTIATTFEVGDKVDLRLTALAVVDVAPHVHDAGDIDTGTLPVARGGTGVNSSTGTGSAVLSNSPSLAGTPTVPQAAPGNNSGQAASTSYVQNELTGKSDTGHTHDADDIDSGILAVVRGGTGVGTKTGTGSAVLSNSPALTGNPTATTQAAGDNSTRLATTAYVQSQTSISGDVVTSSGSNSNGNYRVWSDGFKEQWGQTTTIASSTSPKVQTFPVAFASTPKNVQVTRNTLRVWSYGNEAYANRENNTSVTLEVTSNDGNASAVDVFWYACGY